MTTREQIEMVMRLVAERSGVTVAEMKSQDRHAQMSWRRHIAIWIARSTPMVVFGLDFGHPPIPEIKKAFRRRSYGAVSYACRAVEDQMSINSKIKAELEALRTEIQAAVAEARSERPFAAESVFRGVNGHPGRKNRVSTL